MVRLVRPGVGGVVAVVAHHPEATGRYDDIERLVGWMGTGEQVRLVECPPIHRDPARLVAADHVIAADPDDPLDEVLVARSRYPQRRADVVQKAAHCVAGRLLGELRLPRRRALEHDDLAPVRITRAVDELVDENSVTATSGAAVQRAFHRAGGNEERLHEERLDEQGEHQRNQHQQRQLAT
jgi:hypothetical protein